MLSKANNRRRHRRHGFRIRMRESSRVIKRRRSKGRVRLTV